MKPIIFSRYPGMPFVDQAGLQYRDPASASWVLGWKVCITTTRLLSFYFKIALVFSASFHFPFIFSSILKCIILLFYFKNTISDVVILLSVVVFFEVICILVDALSFSCTFVCFRILTEVFETHIDNFYCQWIFICICFCSTWDTGSGWRGRASSLRDT